MNSSLKNQLKNTLSTMRMSDEEQKQILGGVDPLTTLTRVGTNVEFNDSTALACKCSAENCTVACTHCIALCKSTCAMCISGAAK